MDPRASAAPRAGQPWSLEIPAAVLALGQRPCFVGGWDRRKSCWLGGPFVAGAHQGSWMRRAYWYEACCGCSFSKGPWPPPDLGASHPQRLAPGTHSLPVPQLGRVGPGAAQAVGPGDNRGPVPSGCAVCALLAHAGCGCDAARSIGALTVLS
jgi:hypothetical protein